MSDVVTLIEKDLDARVLDPSDPLPSAELFLAAGYEQGGTRLLHHHRGMFCHWNGAAYAEVDEAALRANLYQFLKRAKRNEKGKVKPFKPTTSKVNNVLDALKAASNLPAEIEPPAWIAKPGLPPAELIACRNGLLHMPSGTLLPPTPTFFGLNAVPFNYDPDAGDPVEWLRFLESIWGDDPESADTLQEVFGQALAGDTSQQKIILVFGPKRSGKGTIARVLTELLGPINVCAPTLSTLGTNFGLAPLIGKQLAVISDARLGHKADLSTIAERLLSISGEDRQDVDRKFRDHWIGKLALQFLIMTNELPRLVDASGALISRFIILKLIDSFYGREDLGLLKRLLPELPAILNWSLEGWVRLQERGHFTQPESAKDTTRELEDLASPVSAFVRDRCNVSPALEVNVDDLFREWGRWCDANGHQQGSKTIFGRNLKAAFPRVKVAQHKQSDGTRPRYYEGLDLERNAK
jgi:putative DNA primase/helicase